MTAKRTSKAAKVKPKLFKCKCGWRGHNPLRTAPISFSFFGIGLAPVHHYCPECDAQVT